MKAVLFEYFNIRLHHTAKLVTEKLHMRKVRALNHKTVLFQSLCCWNAYLYRTSLSSSNLMAYVEGVRMEEIFRDCMGAFCLLSREARNRDIMRGFITVFVQLLYSEAEHIQQGAVQLLYELATSDKEVAEILEAGGTIPLLTNLWYYSKNRIVANYAATILLQMPEGELHYKEHLVEVTNFLRQNDSDTSTGMHTSLSANNSMAYVEEVKMEEIFSDFMCAFRLLYSEARNRDLIRGYFTVFVRALYSENEHLQKGAIQLLYELATSDKEGAEILEAGGTIPLLTNLLDSKNKTVANYAAAILLRMSEGKPHYTKHLVKLTNSLLRNDTGSSTGMGRSDNTYHHAVQPNSGQTSLHHLPSQVNGQTALLEDEGKNIRNELELIRNQVAYLTDSLESQQSSRATKGEEQKTVGPGDDNYSERSVQPNPRMMQPRNSALPGEYSQSYPTPQGGPVKMAPAINAQQNQNLSQTDRRSQLKTFIAGRKDRTIQHLKNTVAKMSSGSHLPVSGEDMVQRNSSDYGSGSEPSGQMQ